MKKISKIILVLFLFCSIWGCSKPQEEAVEENSVTYEERDVDYSTDLPAFGEDSIAIHYQRNDNLYEKWTLWIWDVDGSDDDSEDDFNYQDDYGVIAYYPLSHFGDSGLKRLGIIVKNKGTWSVKDGTDADRFIELSQYAKDENGVYHVYLAQDDAHIYNSADKTINDSINSAVFTGENTIYIGCSNKVESYQIFADGELVFEGNGAGRTKFTDKVDFSADFAKNYTVKVIFRESNTELESKVDTSGLYSTDAFDEMYYYDGELGAIYSAKSTEFRAWSPISSSIELRIYDSGTPKSVSSKGDDTYTAVAMEKGEKGVFSAVVEGDLEGKYYTYFVVNSKYPEGAEIVDPYARSAGISGLRGMIVDFSKTNPDGWDKVSYLKLDKKSLTVWETHVADVTSSDTWTGSAENKRKYLGLVEEGTTYSEHGVTVMTGFDHIKELGVNAVQLQPIFDQANDETKYKFNWGYNPLNYNVLEGMYSYDPYDGYARIKEFKQVVAKMNEAGIEIIMDVVYNHVNGTERSSFDVLMPYYYYRYNADGSLSNGSGCGNEVASERSMVRKFIVDSVCFWCKEYKLGGFRFDLMGLHDIETMNQVEAALEKINPCIVVYGEPWTGGATTLDSSLQAKQANANQFEGYGQFNDQLRDTLIKGGLSGANEKGWVTGVNVSANDLKTLEAGINGITYNLAYTIADPNKTVNYVTCHDNYTLYDRIKAAGITDEDTIRKMCVLANAIVFTTNGTTFMLAGEEFLRTKQGDSNSYMSSDAVNQLDYSLKIKNLDVFENYKKLIEFKQTTKGIQKDESNIPVESLNNGAVLIYHIDNYLVIQANGIGCEEEIDVKGYHVVLDTLNLLEGSPETVRMEKYQTLILSK